MSKYARILDRNKSKVKISFFNEPRNKSGTNISEDGTEAKQPVTKQPAATDFFHDSSLSRAPPLNSLKHLNFIQSKIKNNILSQEQELWLDNYNFDRIKTQMKLSN